MKSNVSRRILAVVARGQSFQPQDNLAGVHRCRVPGPTILGCVITELHPSIIKSEMGMSTIFNFICNPSANEASMPARHG